MAITRQKKEELIKNYVNDLQNSDNLVIVQQSWIVVTDATKIRRSVMNIWWKFNVIRKRLFLMALKEAWYEEIKVEDLDWSVVALYARGDQYWPLKVINNFLKEYKKEAKKSSFSFLGGWFDKKWYNADYVNDLANMPTKEELIWKLAYLFNYPLQWFTMVLDQIAKKVESEKDQVEKVEAKVEEVKEDVPVEVVRTEESPEAVKEETKAE